MAGSDLLFQATYWARGWKRKCLAGSPLYLTFFVTGRCNASCPQCFYTDHNDPKRVADELTLDEVQRVTQNLPDLPVLLLSGGEPTLRGDLPAIVEAFARNSRTRHVTLPTNGLLPETCDHMVRETLAACPQTQLNVQLSVDEIDERHDRLKGVPGAFARLMETFQRLQTTARENASLRISFCLAFSAYNQDRVPEIWRELRRRTSSTEFRMVLTRGRSRDAHAAEWDVEKFERAVKAIFDITAKEARGSLGRSLFLARQLLAERVIVRTARCGRLQAPCMAGRINVVLDEVGNVYPCELLQEPLGNIRETDYDLGSLLRSDAARTTRRTIKESRCHCTHETNVITNISFVPKWWPWITLTTLGFFLGLQKTSSP